MFSKAAAISSAEEGQAGGVAALEIIGKPPGLDLRIADSELGMVAGRSILRCGREGKNEWYDWAVRRGA
jgi:hypothetical protein